MLIKCPPLSLCVSLSLCISLALSLSLFMSLSLALSLSLPLCLSVFLSSCLSPYVSLSLSFLCLSLSLSLSVSLSLSLYVSLLLSLSLSPPPHGLHVSLPSDLVQEFHRWLSEQREIVKECSDRSGDTCVVDRKLQKIKVFILPFASVRSEVNQEPRFLQKYRELLVQELLFQELKGSAHCGMRFPLWSKD